MAEAGERWVPTQYKLAETVDLRKAKMGPKGYKERNKRTLDEMEELHEQDLQGPTAMEDAVEETQPSSKRRKGTDAKVIPVSDVVSFC